jgi:hypothetical protein
MDNTAKQPPNEEWDFPAYANIRKFSWFEALSYAHGSFHGIHVDGGTNLG